MNHARASEVFMELFMIGNIVAVREKHARDATQPLDLTDERQSEAR
jgi:hypothetical protein